VRVHVGKPAHDVQTWEAPKGVKRFNLQDLAKATNGFDKEHEIGSGGFGKVFIGTFPDGRTLAIKRGSGFAYTPESQSEFKNEVCYIQVYIQMFWTTLISANSTLDTKKFLCNQ
jgi:hypothetical protein